MRGQNDTEYAWQVKRAVRILVKLCTCGVIFGGTEEGHGTGSLRLLVQFTFCPQVDLGRLRFADIIAWRCMAKSGDDDAMYPR